MKFDILVCVMCSCAARHSGVQTLTLGRLDSIGGLVYMLKERACDNVSREHSERTSKYAQFPLVAVAESNKSQTNWGPYYNSFQLCLMTLLPADW